MGRVFTADELAPISENVGAIHKASDLSPVSLIEAKPKETGGIKAGIQQIAKGLPAAGALAGGMVSMAAAPGTMGASLAGGSLLAGAGAALGKGAQNVIESAIGSEEAPKTAIEGAGRIATEFSLNSALNMIGGTLIPKLAKSIRPTMAQAMKAFEGLDEKLGMRVLKDPEILLRAKPIEQAKEEFGTFIKESGFKYGPDAIEEVTGKVRIGEVEANKLINRTIKRIDQVKGLEKYPENAPFIQDTVQDALAGREALSDSIFKEKNKQTQKYLLGKLDTVDDWLESKIPGFAKVRGDYADSMLAEKFKPFLPQNKDGSTSVLRTLAGFGSTVLNPIKGGAAMLAASPYVAGKAIQGAALVGNKAVGAVAAQKVGELLGDKASQFSEGLFSKGIAKEKSDHPEIPDEYLPHLVADELKKDPKFYDK